MSRLVTKAEDGRLQLELPLLAGFSYPIAAMDFSVTLPGQITEDPMFSSGYHGVNIEKDLEFAVSGSTVTGNAIKELKDRETLTMYLMADAAMFPQAQRFAQNFSFSFISISVCSLLALGYWLLFLRTPPAPLSGKTFFTTPFSEKRGQFPF